MVFPGGGVGWLAIKWTAMKSGDVHYPKTNSSHRSNGNNPGWYIYIYYPQLSGDYLKNQETRILSKEQVDSKRRFFRGSRAIPQGSFSIRSGMLCLGSFREGTSLPKHSRIHPGSQVPTLPRRRLVKNGSMWPLKNLWFRRALATELQLRTDCVREFLHKCQCVSVLALTCSTWRVFWIAWPSDFEHEISRSSHL